VTIKYLVKHLVMTGESYQMSIRYLRLVCADAGILPLPAGIIPLLAPIMPAAAGLIPAPIPAAPGIITIGIPPFPPIAAEGTGFIPPAGCCEFPPAGIITITGIIMFPAAGLVALAPGAIPGAGIIGIPIATPLLAPIMAAPLLAPIMAAPLLAPIMAAPPPLAPIMVIGVIIGAGIIIIGVGIFGMEA
jgi:hypothetical protein